MIENSIWQAEMIERHLNAAKAIPFGVSYLDDALIALMPNELMVVGAASGRGKTEFATSIAYEGSKRSRQVTFFALEADKWEIQRRLKYRKLAQFYQQHYAGSALKFPRNREWLLKGYNPEWDALEKMAEKDLNPDICNMRVIYKDERYSVQEFIRDFELLCNETDIFIVDHLHYFDLGRQSEMDGLKDAIHMIRNTTLKYGKPVVLLAHLRKSNRQAERVTPTMDDFHGHSDIVKVATTVLLLSAVPVEKGGAIGHYPTYFHVAKCRTAAEVTPFAGVLGFDFKTNCYSDRYYLTKASLFKDPEPIERASEIPEWAKRAIRPVENQITAPRINSDKKKGYKDD